MNEHTVTVTVPPDAAHLALFRAAVSGYAAREHFTFEQVDDLRMAVDEAGVQLLRQVSHGPLMMELRANDQGIEVWLRATVHGSGPVIDADSFSWVILRALADDLASHLEGDQARIVLRKLRPAAGLGTGEGLESR